MTTTEQLNVALRMVEITGEVIRTLSPVPSGSAYALVMSFMSLEQYNECLSILKGAGVITERGHMLTWTGQPAEIATIEA
jgi:hypothetical protein